jgi:hypothetical protein
MNSFLIIVIGIIVLTNLIYTIWSFFSLKKLIDKSDKTKPEDNFLMENIIHSRTSINLIYASMTIVVFVLGFLGFNLQKNVASDVIRDITKSAQVDLDTLRMKSTDISNYYDDSKENANKINEIKNQVLPLLNKIKETPQKLFVVYGVPINKGNNRIYFSKLKTVDELNIPEMKQPPIILYQVCSTDNSTDAGFGIVAATTNQYYECKNILDEPALLNLWIYVR